MTDPVTQWPPDPPRERPGPDPLFWRGVRNSIVLTVILIGIAAGAWWITT